ncbi:PA2169 family four-helix-bundle protein [Paraburkholderia phosphatilytica]|uniref:PA2169 family four-helix-bundle protein n=1 Tax=Paraburkholderia phosphatilytica TaxID=2282883 RepID=UPI000E47290C|nr:PA2169 family four-helix-bundle protein [Paraburkholderia phosphatilytica]
MDTNALDINQASVLNGLIEVLKDGVLDFNDAAGDAHDPELKRVFNTLAEEYAHRSQELQLAALDLGIHAEADGTMAGAMRRSSAYLKAHLGRLSDDDILAECERAEDAANMRFSEALTSNLPAEVRTLIGRQHAEIVGDRDRIKMLKAGYAARGTH